LPQNPSAFPKLVSGFSMTYNIASYPDTSLYIGLSLPEQDELDERAAIIEFDGGLTREQANQKARELVLAARKQTDWLTR
jgi:hypothetical protein